MRNDEVLAAIVRKAMKENTIPQYPGPGPHLGQSLLARGRCAVHSQYTRIHTWIRKESQLHTQIRSDRHTKGKIDRVGFWIYFLFLPCDRRLQTVMRV